MGDTPAPDLAAAIEGERRLENRHVVHWPVLLNWSAGGQPQAAAGRTLELSFGGARVSAEHNFPLGETLACRISVRPWHGNSGMFDLDVTARVMHCAYSAANDGFDIGLQFTGFAGDGKERLAKVVQALEKGVATVGKVVKGER